MAGRDDIHSGNLAGVDINGVISRAPSGDETTDVSTRTPPAIIRYSRVETSTARVASTSASDDTSELLMPREWRRDLGATTPATTRTGCPVGLRFEVCDCVAIDQHDAVRV